MKRWMILCAGMCVWFAAVAGAQDVVQRDIRLERFAVAPKVQELSAATPALKAYGWEKEIPIFLPDWQVETVPEKVFRDPLSRKMIARKAASAGLSFEGYSNNDNLNVAGGIVAPPDTEGDVGIDFYVQYNNVGFSVFNKSDGSLAAGPTIGNIFWQVPAFAGSPCQTDNAGDPIVIYDHVAGQWMFSQFVSPNTNTDGHQCFAISAGQDPTGPYFLYDFVVSPGAFNDYPKIGLWVNSDGSQSAYVMTTNEFAGNFLGVNVTAFERDAMLVGATAGGVQVTLPFTGAAPVRFSLQPSHLEGATLPPAGSCPYIVQALDDETFGAGGANGPDGYQLWQFCVDFATPANSTFTQGPFLQSANFNGGLTAAPQPGTTQTLDPLGQFTMYRFHNRVLNGEVTGVISHTVDVGGGVNGVRYAVLDLPSLAGASLGDSGTLNPGDGLHRWVPSAAMDGAGNVGLGYTRSGATGSNFPSIYFTGRETTDPPGALQAETSCIDGTGVQLGTNRWGDYASISVDPVDDCTFWVTNEYVETTGTAAWTTRICSFSFPSCTGGGGEPQTVTLTSVAAQDGWVRERNENANTGGRANSTGTGSRGLRAGDDRRDRQVKFVVSFDTSSIPAGATIVSATLRLTRGGVSGTNPFNGGFGNLTVDASSGGFNGNPALENADFEAAATATGVAVMSTPGGNGTLSEGTLSAAGLAAIQAGGTTQFRLQFDVDDNDNAVTDLVGFFPGDNGNASRHPVLEVTFIP